MFDVVDDGEGASSACGFCGREDELYVLDLVPTVPVPPDAMDEGEWDESYAEWLDKSSGRYDSL